LPHTYQYSHNNSACVTDQTAMYLHIQNTADYTFEMCIILLYLHIKHTMFMHICRQNILLLSARSLHVSRLYCSDAGRLISCISLQKLHQFGRTLSDADRERITLQNFSNVTITSSPRSGVISGIYFLFSY